MIIFMNGRHTFVEAGDAEPIVWVDAQDATTYTLSSSVLGSELVVNGGFSNGLTDWAGGGAIGSDISLNLGGCKLEKGTAFSVLRQSYTLIENVNYVISYDILENNNCVSFSTIGSVTDTGSGIGLQIPFSVGSHQVNIKLNGDYPFIAFLNGSNNSDITIDNISVKEILVYDVTALFNKGSLGGAMTLNGTVKFANDGFESWSASDCITRDLGETFLPTNSFTIALVVDWQDFTSGSSSVLQYPMTIEGDSSNYGGSQNYLRWYKNTTTVINAPYVIASSSGFTLGSRAGNPIGLEVSVVSYDVSIGEFNVVNADGTTNNVLSKFFNNVDNTIITLLNRQIGGLNFGANNPLHEFRLYNIAFSLTEMQDLQTELNNKYTP